MLQSFYYYKEFVIINYYVVVKKLRINYQSEEEFMTQFFKLYEVDVIHFCLLKFYFKTRNKFLNYC